MGCPAVTLLYTTLEAPPRQAAQTQLNPELLPATVQQLPNCNRNQRYAFHWYEGEIPQKLGGTTL